MLAFLPAPLLGVISMTLFVVNLVFWIIPFYAVALAKLLIPIRRWRLACVAALEWIGEAWIDCNSLLSRLHRSRWDVTGAEDLARNDWYLVSSNHQAWVDIFVLQHVFNRRIPFLKFFIKKELIWVPLLGLAWWALDMPFMHRHSKEKMRANPELRSQDLEATRKACEHFRARPTAVVNFVEGTRFTAAKRAAQKAPFTHLLRPKTGGLAFVLGSLGDVIHTYLDVTIAYPKERPTFWDLMCGRLWPVKVHVARHEIPPRFTQGNYLEDEALRAEFRDWLDGIWAAKDARLADMRLDT